MGKLSGSCGIALLLACGTGCSGMSPETEALGTEEQAADSQYDGRVLAAFEYYLFAGGLFGYVGVPILVACDDDSRLMYTYRHLINGWMAWNEVPGGGGCVGVPTVAKWVLSDGSESAAIYARFDDNHVWEAWIPALSANMALDFVWNDINVASGFPNPVTDSPMLADSGNTWDVSIVVKQGSTDPKSLYTFDWQDGAWSYRKVYSAGSTAIKTGKSVTTRGRGTISTSNQPAGSFLTGYSYIDGSGYAASALESATAWFALRQNSPGSLTNPYTRDSVFDVSAFPIGSGATGMPATLVPGGGEATEVHVARFGSNLKYRRILPGGSGWKAFSNCYPAGSPRTSTMGYDDGRFIGFIRGGETSGVSNDLLYYGIGGGCTSVGGTLHSAPTPIEYAKWPVNWYNAAYMGSNHQVYFYNSYDDVHEQVPGITLP